jgi:leucyl-tRNA synthetase
MYLHPMGWDSFGMPAENAARENDLNPKDLGHSQISQTYEIRQLKKLGLSVDWGREISTCSHLKIITNINKKFFLETL